jgi:hypothetical protein
VREFHHVATTFCGRYPVCAYFFVYGDSVLRVATCLLSLPRSDCAFFKASDVRSRSDAVRVIASAMRRMSCFRDSICFRTSSHSSAMLRLIAESPGTELRTREHLTPAEVEVLVEAIGKNSRGALMVLLTFRRGLRAAEVVDLRCGGQVDFKTASQHVRSVKNGTPSAHPLPAGNCASFAGTKGKALSRSSGSFRSAARLLGLQPHDRAGSRSGQARHHGSRAYRGCMSRRVDGSDGGAFSFTAHDRRRQ